jgi:hypothetical protein
VIGCDIAHVVQNKEGSVLIQYSPSYGTRRTATSGPFLNPLGSGI